MTLTLDAVYADTAAQTGTSGSLSIIVPPTNRRVLVVALSTDFTGLLSGGELVSLKYRNFSFGGSIVQSTGVAIYAMTDPPPGYGQYDIEVEFANSRIFGMAAYCLSTVPQSGFLRQTGLDGQTTGDPEFSGSFTPLANSIIIDAVKIEQNTIAANSPQVEAMNITSGSGASLISYGSSYYIAPNTDPVPWGWTRQGSPVDDTWGLCAREIITAANRNRIITS